MKQCPLVAAIFLLDEQWKNKFEKNQLLIICKLFGLGSPLTFVLPTCPFGLVVPNFSCILPCLSWSNPELLQRLYHRFGKTSVYMVVVCLADRCVTEPVSKITMS